MCRVVAEGGDGLTTTCQWETFIGTNIGIAVTAEVTATALRPCVKKRAVHGLASIDIWVMDEFNEFLEIDASPGLEVGGRASTRQGGDRGDPSVDS
jgi:hypothetical protein